MYARSYSCQLPLGYFASAPLRCVMPDTRFPMPSPVALVPLRLVYSLIFWVQIDGELHLGLRV